MVVPHYVYLLLKMPGNTGVLSLRGGLLKSFECDKEAIVHASSIRAPSSVSEILAAAKELSLNRDSMPCWRFLCPIRIDILQAHKITAVALHLGVFQGIVFYPQGSTMVKSIVNRLITVLALSTD